MNYKISYKSPAKQYLPIEAIFDAKNDAELTLQFPTWRPGRYERGDFAKNLKNFAVTDENNKKLAFHKTSKDTWLVNCSTANQIKVTYYYFAAELNAGSSFMDDTQLYVNPVNCLVYIKERQNQPCTLELDIPSDFELACGASHSQNKITCADYHELVDSPFIASNSMQHRTYTVLGIDFHLWFQGGVELDWERIISDFEKFTLVQIEKFSNRRERILGFPVKEYHFLYQILQIKAYHGVEHQTGTVVALGPSTELMGKLYDDFLGVSSHELYHTWNIKSIRPAEMYPYDYSTENYSHLGYVAEGVTTYLGDVFLAESGVKDFGWYQKELEKLLQRHFDNFGRFNYSVAESSWDTWLDGYVKGAPDRKVSIYNEGALLAFVMDMKIRAASQNKFSIHDIMNKLYVDFAQKNKGYEEKDYINACQEFSGQDLTDFFNDFVHGTRPFESILVEALEVIGFTLEMENNPKHSERILGIKLHPLSPKNIIHQIFPGSSAELGGLMLGDEILSVNGSKIEKTFDETLEPFRENPLELKINRMGRELDVVCPNTNRAMFPTYKIKKVKVPSNLGKRIFKKWIGHNWEDC